MHDTYHQVFYASPDYISFSRLADGTYIDVNPNFEKFTGLRRDEIIGRTALQIGIWSNPEKRKDFIEALRKSGSLQSYYVQIRLKSGELRDCEFSANVAAVDGEQVLVVVGRDVTERMRAEAELKRYREQLEQLVEQRTEELHRINMELAVKNEQLQVFATVDGLTGACNRRHFMALAQNVFYSSQRYAKPLAVMMLDIDHFKYINDIHGHATGDAFLKAFAEACGATLRSADMFGRYGGEEFVLALPETDHVAAELVADRLRKRIGEIRIARGPDQISATVSIGVTMCCPTDRNIEDAIARADGALYTAKTNGRNQTIVQL
jgi:diguanylate cyclase (GGDEF)-like protein/PAS domain S-box-containing protein